MERIVYSLKMALDLQRNGFLSESVHLTGISVPVPDSFHPLDLLGPSWYCTSAQRTTGCCWGWLDMASLKCAVRLLRTWRWSHSVSLQIALTETSLAPDANHKDPFNTLSTVRLYRIRFLNGNETWSHRGGWVFFQVWFLARFLPRVRSGTFPPPLSPLACSLGI